MKLELQELFEFKTPIIDFKLTQDGNVSTIDISKDIITKAKYIGKKELS